MSKTIERIDSIRFERIFSDGTKAYFSAENPTGLTLSNGQSFADTETKNIMMGINHSWDSVFSEMTRIVLVGEIRVESDGITTYHEGEFDFYELQERNIVRK